MTFGHSGGTRQKIQHAERKNLKKKQHQIWRIVWAEKKTGQSSVMKERIKSIGIDTDMCEPGKLTNIQHACWMEAVTLNSTAKKPNYIFIIILTKQHPMSHSTSLKNIYIFQLIKNTAVNRFVVKTPRRSFYLRPWRLGIQTDKWLLQEH